MWDHANIILVYHSWIQGRSEGNCRSEHKEFVSLLCQTYNYSYTDTIEFLKKQSWFLY